MRHKLDVYPVPREKSPMYINEPWIIDKTKLDMQNAKEAADSEPEKQEDNIRVYVPLDLNKEAILRRIDRIIYEYGEANELNEMDFQMDVEMLISQIEIYDQIWFVRNNPKDGGDHSQEAKELVRIFVQKLENIPDGGAECFPFDVIEMLNKEYLGITEETVLVESNHFDYASYEERCTEIREENNVLLDLFYQSLQGLSPKTIREHMGNAELYINDYLLYEDAQTFDAGTKDIGDFLGYFFIRKCMWSTPGTIKRTAVSIKKFYKCMLEHGKIQKEAYENMCYDIKEGMENWQETCARYNDPDADDPFGLWYVGDGDGFSYYKKSRSGTRFSTGTNRI